MKLELLKSKLVAGLDGLPQSYDLASVLAELSSGHYLVELQVGNCNGWKPKKHRRHFYMKNLSNLSIGGLSFSPTWGQPALPIGYSSCQSPVLGSWTGSHLEWSNTTGAAEELFLTYKEYKSSDCSPTGFKMTGYSLSVGDISDLTSLNLMSYLAQNATNHFYSISPFFSQYTFKISVYAANSCSSNNVMTFWWHPNTIKGELVETNTSVTLVGNPVVGNLSLDIQSNEDQEMTCQIINAVGQVLKTTQFDVSKGESMNTVDVSELSSGLYYYSVFSRKQLLKTAKFVKQ